MAKKRIIDLPNLESGSVNTILVGHDNGTTYQIKLNVLTASVVEMLSQSTDARLDFLEEFQNDFYVISASIDTKIAAATNEQSLAHLVTTSSLNTFTQSYQTDSSSFTQRIIDATNEQDLSYLATTQSVNNLSTSVDSRLDTLESFSSSADNRYVLSGSITQTTWDNIVNKPNDIVSSSTQISDLGFVTGSYAFLTEFNSLTQSFNIISGSVVNIESGFDTASYQLFTQSIDSRVNSLEAATASYLTSLDGSISSSTQIEDLGFITASTPTDLSSLNTISASYLTFTQSYYSDSSSFNSRIISGSAVAGTISSSAQISGLGYATTSSLNSFTSSYNTDSSSFNSRFNGLVTTGSNTFSGSQVFSGSMTVTSGQVVASSITANTSSLYLTSGSNLYLQNNGVVEITGSLKVKGTSRFETVGGDEGGEIEFGVPQTNTTLSTSVKADIYQNRFRIFDGNTNGVYIDLSKAPTGANGELMHKASGFVNAGDYVTLGNLKARIPTSGNRSLQVATVSGTYSVYGSGIYSQIGGIAGSTLSSPLSITTTPAYLNAANGFTVAGAMDTWVIIDTVNFIAWRITMIIGPLFNANLITIERLY